MRQKGSVFQHSSKRGPIWAGRYRLPKAEPGARRKERWITLGLISEMTEEQARGKLQQQITGINVQIDFIAGERQRLSVMSPYRTSGHLGCIGVVSELRVCSDLMAKGWNVYRALNPQAPCDVLCFDTKRVLRIEVKTAPEIEKGATVEFCLKNKIGKFDILALVHKNGTIEYRAYAGMTVRGDDVICYLVHKNARHSGDTCGMDSENTSQVVDSAA
jgi:hypothetical protein